MIKIHIDLDNNPAPHNQSATNRYGGVYKSKREVAYINDLLPKLIQEVNSRHITTFSNTPLRVTYKFGFKPPKSWSKKKTQQALNHSIYPTNTNNGDWDNLVKCTQDRLMDAQLIEDDRYIVKGSASKEYSSNPYVEITIEVIDD